MPRSSADLSVLALAGTHRAAIRETVHRRSWFYRFFIAPFADMDHRAVYRAQQKSGTGAGS